MLPRIWKKKTPETAPKERKKNPRSSQKEIADGIQNIQQEISEDGGKTEGL